MGPRNAYKDMLDNVVSPISCVSMNHQNQLEKMAYEPMFATIFPFLVINDNTSKASINLHKLTNLELLTLAWMLTIIQTLPRSNFPLFDLLILCSHIAFLFPTLETLACFDPTFSPFGINSPKKIPKQNFSKETSKS
jgi:hypothetical protein